VIPESRSRPRRRVEIAGWILSTMVWIVLAPACTSRQPATPPESSPAATMTVSPPSQPPGLRIVTLPDLSRMGESVQQQMRAQFSLLRSAVERRDTSAAELSSEYGRMGTLLAAAEQIDAAEPCYLNAQTLAPSDARWPYYLGQLYRLKGPVESAAASFERALQLQPGDVPTLVWLGEVYLTQGRSDQAEPQFSKALTLQPKLVPALFGMGRVALSRKDYSTAVKLLEECLALDPRATATHYPLGMAYRGLGNARQAQLHLEQPGDVKIQPVDPLMTALDEILESPRAYDIRGGRSLEIGDWKDAAAQFRKGLDLDPSNAALRLRLGTALFQMGEVGGAQEQFERVLQVSPRYARAHYSLGIMAAAAGHHDEALRRLSSAVEFGPDDAAARVALAGLLRQDGRFQQALEQYAQARKLEPKRVDATLGYVVTLANLARYQEARDRLVEATTAYPDEPEFAHALARLLAAAPDDQVRNGRRALAMVQQLLKGQRSTALGETFAMALAENGLFDQAIQVQDDVIAANAQAGVADESQAMAANLRLYKSRKPSRTPWPGR
jgi:tetratricopeptide (TPR) repeat protein